MKSTLRTYLFDKRLALYDRVNVLKDRVLSETFTERDTINLEVAEAELAIIKEVLAICQSRRKY